jgi:hypothetical protein
MNAKRFRRSHWIGLVSLVAAAAVTLSGQARPTNLYREVVDKKARIVWRNAPANSVPPDVCTILTTCAGAPDKLIALPPATESGVRVTRGLILSRTNDAQKADMVVLLRQTPAEAYFFAVAPDGNLQKAAYWTTGRSWVQIGTALSRPVFDKDKQVWLDHVAKLGGAPAAAPTSN